MNLFLNRLFRAAKLNTDLYQEVISDAGTMFQAMMAVFVYSASTAYGGFARAGVAGINFAMITTLIGWYIWAFSTYFIGTRLLSEDDIRTDRKAVLRAMGFATAPGLFRLAGLIPDMAGISFIISSIWIIAAAVLAVKLVLNFKSIYRAAGACILGLIISIIFQGLMYISLLSVFGIPNQQF